jgi:hypothetical protein
MVIRISLIISLLFSALFLAAAGCGGGGGGTGGGGSTTISVFGRIIWIENGGAPSPAATIRIGSVSTTTNAADGGFALDVPSGATSVTVSTTVAGKAIIRTFTFPAASSSVDLGDLFIGPDEVSVSGRLVSSSTGSSIAGATVTLAGRRAVSAADGSFTIALVAYSSASQAVFLGLQGEASATGFFTGFFSPPAAAVGGVVAVGNISLVPTGGDAPPPLPYNLIVTCTPSGSGATVEVLSGATVIRTLTADSAGKATFWLPAGAYTVRAVKAAQTGSSPVTITSTNSQTSINVTLS